MPALIPYAGKEPRQHTMPDLSRQMLNLFRAGNSTLEIARKMSMPEHVVYNLLARARR